MLDIELAGEAATLRLGRRLGRALAPATEGVLSLSGQLGAGKTTLVKGLAEGLGVAASAEVTSPTFLRMTRFPGPPDLVHVDAYRMQGPGEVLEMGLDEDLAGGAVVAIEWPEMIEDALPSDRIRVDLSHGGPERRTVRMVAGGELAGAWLGRLMVLAKREERARSDDRRSP